MKRRLISALLAVLILVGLLPAGALSVSAESTMTASPEAIELLKSWEGFLKYPKWDNSQYTIGYGTGCDPDDYPNGITEEQAEVLLREHMAEVEASVSSFADKNGLTFNQNQFDALLLFSYNVGTGWMYGNQDIRNAVIMGMTGNDFIFYLTRWCLSGGSISTGHIKRRLAEADIYLNGYYGKRAPDCFTYVLFNGNGGSYTYNVQGYDATEPVDVKATAMYAGYTFLGWYTAKEGGQWITTLDSTTKGLTLYARWQEGQGNVDDNGNILGTEANYQRITTAGLNVYAAPAADAQVITAVNSGTYVVITADYVDENGTKWGKLENGCWIELTDTNAVVMADEAPDRSNSVTLGSGVQEEDKAEEESFSVSVQVTSSSVNFRKGPGTGYTKLGTLSYGQQLIISEVVDVDGTLWGKFSYGWLCLMYTDYDEVIQQGNTGNTVVATGTVISSGALRIRSGAGTNYATVGTLNSGSKVKIYEIAYNGDTPWGRISTGWICLTYVHYTMGDVQDQPSNEETTDPDTNVSGTPVNMYGWVTAVALNVRAGAGSSYDIVARLSRDTYVNVTELLKVGGTQWGKVEQGWICMDFILIDTANSDSGAGDAEIPEVDENPGTEGTPDTGSDTGLLTGMVSASNLCVRSGPGTNFDIVTTLPNGTKVTIRQQTLVNGVVWGQTEQGWVCMTYVRIISSGNVSVCTGMVTASNLCIRTAAGTGNAITGTYSRGTVVKILEISSVNGTLWGRTDKGWICMDYVQVTANPDSGTEVPNPEEPTTPEETPDPEEPTVPEETPNPEEPTVPEETPDTEVTTDAITGVVTASNLCVRSAPGTGSTVVTTIPKGTEVTVLQQTLVDGTVWGQIEGGWICMTYVRITSSGNVAVCTGMVTASRLSIRSAAGTTNAIVGTYYRGDVVEILEITEVNKTIWGRTDKGWICMDYVQTAVMPDVSVDPDTGSDTGSDSNTESDSGTGSDADTGSDSDSDTGAETAGSSFGFTAGEYVDTLNAALQNYQAKVVSRDSSDAEVLCYELVSAADESTYSVMLYLELAEDGQHVAGITLMCNSSDENACNNLAVVSSIVMLLVDDTITEADLEEMLSGDPETDDYGAEYYVMERASGIFAYILDASAECLYFCVYPAAE